MAIRKYEGMFLLDSGRYASDPDGMVSEVMDILERIEADVIAHRAWQDGKLAYPINGHRKGLHYLVYFTADSGQMDELSRLVRLNTRIMRHMVIVPPEQLYDLMANSLLNPGQATEGEVEAASTSETDENTPADEAQSEPVTQEA